MFLFMGDVNRHAPVLYRSALGITGQHSPAAEPADRAVFFDKAEIIARCGQNVIVKKTGSRFCHKGIPVFRVNAAQERIKRIRKIILVAVAHQPAEAVAPLYRGQGAVRRKVDYPASCFSQIRKKTDRRGLFFYAHVLFIVCQAHKGLPSPKSALRFTICFRPYQTAFRRSCFRIRFHAVPERIRGFCINQSLSGLRIARFPFYFHHQQRDLPVSPLLCILSEQQSKG